jgi:hypothetical protein
LTHFSAIIKKRLSILLVAFAGIYFLTGHVLEADEATPAVRSFVAADERILSEVGAVQEVAPVLNHSFSTFRTKRLRLDNNSPLDPRLNAFGAVVGGCAAALFKSAPLLWASTISFCRPVLAIAESKTVSTYGLAISKDAPGSMCGYCGDTRKKGLIMNYKISAISCQHHELLAVTSVPYKARTACTKSRPERYRGVIHNDGRPQKRRLARGRANRKFECPRAWRKLSVELRMPKPTPGNTRRTPVCDAGHPEVPLSRMQYAPNS